MNKNSNMFSRRKSQIDRDSEIHPIWRGVGFVLMIFLPILSYIGAMVIMDYNNTMHWFPIPNEFIVRWKNWQDPYILMRLFITVLLCFLIYALFSLVTFFMHSLFGPKRYIAPDIAPLRKKRRK
jgi:hypothetical protein